MTAMHVPIWDSSGNFNAWTDKVMTALQDKGCAIVVVCDLRRVTADEPLKCIFSAAGYKTDDQAASVIKNVLSDIHDGQFTNMTAFEIWAELKKLYGMQSVDDMVNKIIDLFNIHMAPDDMDSCRFLVHFNFLQKKIDLTGLTCDNLINLILLALRNKHYELVHTEFSKTLAAQISELEIFKFGGTLSDRMKVQVEQDEKHGKVTVTAAANMTRPVCKHCNCIGHMIDTCWTCNSSGSGKHSNGGGGGNGNGNCNNRGSRNGNGNDNRGNGSNGNGGNIGHQSDNYNLSCNNGIYKLKLAGAAIYAAHALLVDPFNASEPFWILDSGANASTCNDKCAFESITQVQGNICTISRNGIDICSQGAAQLDSKLIFDDVLHVPQSKLNLLSVSLLTKNNVQVLFNAHGAYVYCDSKPILYALEVNGLYPVMAALLRDPRLADASTIQTRDANLVTAAGDDLGDDAHWFYELTPSADSNCAELDTNSNDEYARDNDDGYEPAHINSYGPARDDGYESVRDDGYGPARNDGYGPARNDGYEPAHMDDNTEALPNHAMDVYDHTFGDGWNGSASSDGYSDDGGDVATHYDDTFITAAERPATPYHMPGTI
ncbi:hypothetical protein IWW49_004691 [Coemansia sp. RSA 1797]|nr:hypothetical protein IWW49_004691 [Coemansia sp. RSA 1797]